MNVLVVGNGPFPRPQWFDALRDRYANAGVFIVDATTRGVDILSSGVDITTVVINLPLTADEVIREAERLCGATLHSGAPLPWIIAFRDGSDDEEALMTLRQRGVNVATNQNDTLQLLDAAWARGPDEQSVVAEAGVSSAVVEDCASSGVADGGVNRQPVEQQPPEPVEVGIRDAPTGHGDAISDVPCGGGGDWNGDARLTPRQAEVLVLVNEGKSNKEIARVLDLAEGTVKVHCKAIFRALGVTNRTQAAVLIAKAGFTAGVRADG